MSRSVLAALLPLLLLLSVPASSEPCGWLPTRDVDAALPELAPWRVSAGGVAGGCEFVTADSNIFTASQWVDASAQEAASRVRRWRDWLMAQQRHTVAAAPRLGAEAFIGREKEGESSDRFVFFVAHEGRITVYAGLFLQVPVRPEHIAGATRLVRAALAIEGNPEALAAATSCPWFTHDVLRKLLPGEGFELHGLGSRQCTAEVPGSVVVVTVLETDDPAAVVRLLAVGCTAEPVTALGPTGVMLWACSPDRRQANVLYVIGNRLIWYQFHPGRELTAAERALLVELATSAPARPH